MTGPAFGMIDLSLGHLKIASHSRERPYRRVLRTWHSGSNLKLRQSRAGQRPFPDHWPPRTAAGSSATEVWPPSARPSPRPSRWSYGCVHGGSRGQRFLPVVVRSRSKCLASSLTDNSAGDETSAVAGANLGHSEGMCRRDRSASQLCEPHVRRSHHHQIPDPWNLPYYLR